MEIGNTPKKSAAHSRESRGPPRAVKIEMMSQWGATYAWKTHPSLRARTQTQTHSGLHCNISEWSARACGLRASVAKANKLLVFRGERKGSRRTMATCLTRQVRNASRVDECSSRIIITLSLQASHYRLSSGTEFASRR